eukprot:2134480-Prymnesium_polylepis.1
MAERGQFGASMVLGVHMLLLAPHLVRAAMDDASGSPACLCVDPWTTRFGPGNDTLVTVASTGGVGDTCAFLRAGQCLPRPYGTGCA